MGIPQLHMTTVQKGVGVGVGGGWGWVGGRGWVGGGWVWVGGVWVEGGGVLGQCSDANRPRSVGLYR